MATTTMAVGFGGMSVSAVSETASWSARYVNVHGAPTTESRTGYATMQASSEVYTGKVRHYKQKLDVIIYYTHYDNRFNCL